MIVNFVKGQKPFRSKKPPFLSLKFSDRRRFTPSRGPQMCHIGVRVLLIYLGKRGRRIRSPTWERYRHESLRDRVTTRRRNWKPRLHSTPFLTLPLYFYTPTRPRSRFSESFKLSGLTFCRILPTCIVLIFHHSQYKSLDVLCTE